MRDAASINNAARGREKCGVAGSTVFYDSFATLAAKRLFSGQMAVWRPNGRLAAKWPFDLVNSRDKTAKWPFGRQIAGYSI